MNHDAREEILSIDALYPGGLAGDLQPQAHGQHEGGDAGRDPSKKRVEREESGQRAVQQLDDGCGRSAQEERIDLRTNTCSGIFLTTAYRESERGQGH